MPTYSPSEPGPEIGRSRPQNTHERDRAARRRRTPPRAGARSTRATRHWRPDAAAPGRSTTIRPRGTPFARATAWGRPRSHQNASPGARVSMVMRDGSSTPSRSVGTARGLRTRWGRAPRASSPARTRPTRRPRGGSRRASRRRVVLVLLDQPTRSARMSRRSVRNVSQPHASDWSSSICTTVSSPSSTAVASRTRCAACRLPSTRLSRV